MSLNIAQSSKPGRPDDAGHDLNELLARATRKRSIISDELAARRQRRGSVLIVCAIAGLGECGLAATLYLGLANPVFIAMGIGLAGAMGSAAAIVAFIAQAQGRLDQMIADVHRWDAVLAQLKALRRSDDHAALGSLIEELTEIADRYESLDAVKIVPERRHERIEAQGRTVGITFPGGERRTVTVRDISRSGVAIDTDARIKIGAVLTLGSTPARAVRSIPGGMAFEFLRPFPRDAFSADITL